MFQDDLSIKNKLIIDINEVIVMIKKFHNLEVSLCPKKIEMVLMRLNIFGYKKLPLISPIP